MFERIYGVDAVTHDYIYREPYKRHGDGQLDSDEQPVWLLADINDMTEDEILQAESNRLAIC